MLPLDETIHKGMWKEGEPCNHRGCLSHITHPCEGCGRIGGISPNPLWQKYWINRLRQVNDELHKSNIIVIGLAHAIPPEDLHIRWLIKEAQNLLDLET